MTRKQCTCCPRLIYNKALNAQYCKRCAKELINIKKSITDARIRMLKKYPHMKIECLIHIQHKPLPTQEIHIQQLYR